MKNMKMIFPIILLFISYSCSDNVTVAENAISLTLDFTTFETFGTALADQITEGDGAGIDNTFRNSGVVIDESDNSYFGVNGVHPINSGDYTSYYPKSVVKASLETDEIIRAYSFSSLNNHEVDMEALTYGPEEGYLYIGDEYNYIYKMNLSSGNIEQEWDLSTINVSTNTDKGIEAISYSHTTGKFYVGIQAYSSVIELTLADDGSVTRENEFAVSGSPSGLFAHSDGTLYVLTFSSIYRFNVDGSQICELEIPDGLGMTRPDGIFIDSNDEFIYLADSQGPLNDGYSMYKIAWTRPCD